jgi:CubicO group peptidase (beta-lactamase class C family)
MKNSRKNFIKGHLKEITILISTLFLILALSMVSFSQTLEEKVDEYIDPLIQMEKFSGSILIAQKGEILFSKGYGMANYEHNVPNTSHTKFRMGSLTKQFTAMAIMQLQEKGLLDVEGPIIKYFPDYPEAGKIITIHHLLTHTSGIPSFTGFPDFQKTSMMPSSLEETIARFKDKALEFAPGEKYNYSNSGYILLGAIIEKVSGQSYEEGLINAAYTDMSIPHGAGALYTTAEDLYLWDRALYTEKLVKKSSLDKIFTPFMENSGYGWGIGDSFNRKVVAHSGGINGFTTRIARYLDDEVCVIVLINIEGIGVGDIARDLAAIIFGEKYEIPRVRLPIEIDPRIYDSYIGEYEFKPDSIITITTENNRIFAEFPGQDKFEIYPESEMIFFLKTFDAQITFIKNEQGKVTEFIWHQAGGDMPAKKIK